MFEINWQSGSGRSWSAGQGARNLAAPLVSGCWVERCSAAAVPLHEPRSAGDQLTDSSGSGALLPLRRAAA